MAQQMQFGQQPGLAADAYTLAQTYQIGTPVTEYKNNTVTKTVLGITLSILGGLFLLFGLLALFIGGSFFAKLVLILIGLSLLIYGISQIRTARRNRGARLYLCSDGVMRVQGDQVQAIRWDQMTSIQKTFTELSGSGTKSYLLKQYILLRPDGTQLVLDNSFGKFKECGAAIEQQVTTRLLPGALAAFQSGQLLPFGPIGVSAQGVSAQNGQKVLPWGELKQIQVRNGELKVKKEGAFLDWEIIPTSGMPNLCVLVALLNSITNGQKIQVR
jgi:hypothetical protein